ncbi:GNAT family N-acetyltransferase [Zunongwangia pacifica]|uniref:GNAT family N-acetyltransferase n=1 Tax=Zunongwangia pacifica TaxID=2911062 RepID=A0A9X2A1S1_9FLAO|nr:GNAT family N-acetyltransferase [Zunongwangia pacifica]MCL6220466.1 GNAT family N-acetyltransferase [Zunongwangia pacifica]
MELKTLESIDRISILNAFNECFSDYFIPFKLTEEQLISKMTSDKIDLSISVGAFENGKLNAFILHGFDNIKNQKVVCNGGTGVVPDKRGFGLTKKMYHFILPILEKKGINKIILEVINKNFQAIKSYEKSGFAITRELVCCNGSFEFKKKNKEVTLKKLENHKWIDLESFWDIRPTWQNSNSVLDNLKATNILLGAYIKNKLVGYVIFNPNSCRIHQIAIAKNYRRKGIASTLLWEMKIQNGAHFSVINIDKKSESTVKFFNSLGLKNYLEQLEMELKINNH